MPRVHNPSLAAAQSVLSEHRVPALGMSGGVFLSCAGRALGESSIAASYMTKDTVQTTSSAYLCQEELMTHFIIQMLSEAELQTL